MKNREKTENIGQTRKNDDARRKTHQKKSDNRGVREKKTFSSSKGVKSIRPNTENCLRKLYDKKTITMTRAMRTSMRPTTA